MSYMWGIADLISMWQILSFIKDWCVYSAIPHTIVKKYDISRGIKTMRRNLVWIPRQTCGWFGLASSWDVVIHVGNRRFDINLTKSLQISCLLSRTGVSILRLPTRSTGQWHECSLVNDTDAHLWVYITLSAFVSLTAGQWHECKEKWSHKGADGSF